MIDDQIKYYRRNLPHYHPANATFFVTFRLAGSLPSEAIVRLKEERVRDEALLLKIEDEKARKQKMAEQHERYFSKFDELLDSAVNSQSWLKDERVADMVAAAMCFRDKKVYDLLAYCIMPNHVHVVFTVERSATSLYKALQSLKAYTAREANKILLRNGAFWQHESYDHVVRDGKKLERIIDYVLHNPVKAGLVSSRELWKWSYYRK
ncbi:MAG TPA: transposase [Candidatus Brocadiaceae bacterium]|nr:transposase [Candidatus Brocadiaceae bacterium]